LGKNPSQTRLAGYQTDRPSLPPGKEIKFKFKLDQEKLLKMAEELFYKKKEMKSDAINN